jgi:hypothetical protein
MYCLDCLNDGEACEAVAICHSCGSGICAEHASAIPVHLVRMGVILREERVEPPAREMLCPTCLAARQAAETGSRRIEDHKGSAHRGRGSHEAGGRKLSAILGSEA